MCPQDAGRGEASRSSSVPSVRIDKWLWAARFYKTRALAARACELGRVSDGGQQIKPSRDVKVGQMLLVKNDSSDFEIEVLALSEIRGPASVAQTLYRETETSRAKRQQLALQRKLMPHIETGREGRPSKRDRREIERFRGRS